MLVTMVHEVRYLEVEKRPSRLLEVLAGIFNSLRRRETERQNKSGHLCLGEWRHRGNYLRIRAVCRDRHLAQGCGNVEERRCLLKVKVRLGGLLVGLEGIVP